MPKAPAPRKAKSARTSPTKTQNPQDPRSSHLYTDDNPSTTIHGTGFKDQATARHTLDLIGRRSLLYQFQTVNTLYNRAKHHPAMKKAGGGASSTADMRAAMDVFREWLDVTYPAARRGLRLGGFKPLLSKGCVERRLEAIEAGDDDDDDGGIDAAARAFARVYCSLGKGKRLGNALVEASEPAGPDWERRRYEALDALVPAGKETEAGWEGGELWTEEGGLTAGHLELVAWAWSPCAERKLA